MFCGGLDQLFPPCYLQIKLGAVVEVSCHVPVHGHGRQRLLVRYQTLEEVVAALNGAGLVGGPGLNTVDHIVFYLYIMMLIISYLEGSDTRSARRFLHL